MKKTNQPQENMNTMQLEKKTRSNAKIDDLYRKIQSNENQKVKVRKYIRDLMKEEKTTHKINW